MLLNHLARILQSKLHQQFFRRYYGVNKVLCGSLKHLEDHGPEPKPDSVSIGSPSPMMGELYQTATRVVPMVMAKKEQIVMSFDEVPGPRALKALALARKYLSELGTQLTANALTLGFNIGNYINQNRSMRYLSALFDEYGPVVRFVSPIGRDIVLINHPDHIQKVYSMEGSQPLRSTLDCLERYRILHRHRNTAGIYNTHGDEWLRQRSLIDDPLNQSLTNHLHGLSDICDNFTEKIYNLRSYQDEITSDLYKELHKWAFDSMGLLIFAKSFTMLNTEIVYSQCDMSWLYHSLDKTTEAISKCESGMQLWKLFPTPAWHSLVKYCDNLDNLIGKHVLEEEQKRFNINNEAGTNTLIGCMLNGKDKMSAEDITTVLMDMLLIGVNTITTATSFMFYFLAKHQKAQRILYKELQKNYKSDDNLSNIMKSCVEMPYMRACIKETLRLVPPIPVLTRILSKNIILDRYNIPRGTLIIMSNEDASLKESNFDNATKFDPERWLRPDVKDCHAFASIPFGFGARRCLGQSIAETMMTMITAKTLEKYKLEYHYGDIQPTRTFIVKPKKPIKIRFIDRLYE